MTTELLFDEAAWIDTMKSLLSYKGHGYVVGIQCLWGNLQAPYFTSFQSCSNLCLAGSSSYMGSSLMASANDDAHLQ